MRALVESVFVFGVAGYLLLALFAFLRREDLSAWRLFLLALSATALWLGVQGFLVSGVRPNGLLMLGADTARGLAWAALLAHLLPQGHDYRRTAQRIPFIAMLPAFGLAVAGMLGMAVSGAMLLYYLALAVILLVLSEQLYRASGTEARWAVKFLCLGTGVLSVYDIYLYAQGLLLHSLDLEILQARGAVHLLALPFFAVSLLRLSTLGNRAAVALSGSGATLGLTLFAVGAYLLAVAAGGYFVRGMGGTWSRYWEIVFLFLAFLLLTVILASGRFRAWIRVMSKKHLLPYRYDYREEWLRLMHDLHSPAVSEAMPVRGIAAVANLVESPAGIFWALETRVGGFRPIAVWGRPLPGMATIPADLPALRPLFERQWVLEVDGDDPELSGRLLLRDPWLLVPLPFEDELTGFIELAAPRLGHDLDWEDYDLLRLAGMEVGAAYVQYRNAARLAEAGQFDAYHKMAAFVLHDIKNIVQQQSLLLKNAARHRDNPEFIDLALRTIENSVQRMNRLIERMREGSEAPDVRRVDPGIVLASVVRRCGDRRPVPQLEAEEGLNVRVDAERFASVVEHLIRNAQDATPETGAIHVRLAGEGDRVVIEIRDTGCGMSPEFLQEKYFKPFESSKKRAGMGIGAYQAREFARGAGGDLLVESMPGKGTIVRMILPMAEGGSGDAQ